MKNLPLLLTSCIEPRYTNGVVRNDPNIRLNDYAHSLKSWIKKGGWNKIVFADNSGWTENHIRSELSSRIGNSILDSCEFEILCCDDTPRPELHYGYSELGIFDQAVAKSYLLQHSSHFMKATGRLYFPKADLLRDQLDETILFWVDARSHILFWSTNQITTQLMIFSTEFYRNNLYDIRKRMSPDLPFIEPFLFNILLPWNRKSGCRFRWPVNIDPEGVAAHSGINYSSGRRRFHSNLRAISRQMFPGIWF